MENRLFSNKSYKLAGINLFALIAFLVTITVPVTSVNALGSTFPIVGDEFSPNVNATVPGTVTISAYDGPAVAGDLWGIDTGVTGYKIYTTTLLSRPFVTINHACEGSPHGTYDIANRDFEFPTGRSQTRWRFFTTFTNELRGPEIDGTQVLSSRKTCDGSGDSSGATVSGSAASSIIGRRSYDVYLLEADENVQEGDHGAGKGFDIVSAGGYVTPQDLFTEFPGQVLNPGNPNTGASARAATALMDANQGATDNVYKLSFKSDCTLEDSQRIFFKWFDMDIGLNQDDGAYLEVYENNPETNNLSARVSLQPWSHTTAASGGAMLPAGGGTHLRVTGTDLNGGANGSTRLGQVSFNAVRDTKYTVKFGGINGTNALQFWAPFPEVEQSEPCPPPVTGDPEQYDVGGVCAVRGYYYYPPNPDEKYTIYAQFRLVNSAGTQTAGWSTAAGYTDVANRATPDPPGLNISNGFRFITPDNRLSATDRTQVRLWAFRADGSRDDFLVNMDLGVCGEWNHQVDLTGSPADSATGPKPGDTLTLTSVVTNTPANMTSNPYTHQIRWQLNGGAWTNIMDRVNEGGLDPDEDRDRSATFTIPVGTAHDAEYCFQARVLPASGTNLDGWSESPLVCYTVYNLRFDLNTPVITIPTTARPGQDITLVYTIANDDDEDLPSDDGVDAFDPPNASNQFPTGPFYNATPGVASDVDITITGDLGSDSFNNVDIAANTAWPLTVSFRIPDDAEVGDEYCTTVTASLNRGYSDGTDLSGSPESATDCLTISDAMYLQAYGNDVWSGGGFDLEGVCSVTGAGAITTTVTDNPAGTEWVGGLDELAAFARGPISNFGTAEVANSPLLAFANDPTVGDFGADRCLSNLFDNGGAGGRILDELWNNASTTPVLNSARNFEDQFRFSGNQDLNAAWANVTGKRTILIDGNLTIGNMGQFSYSNTAAAPADLPVNVFIVAGDILIDHRVEEMAGIFIALGTINTCDSGLMNSPLAVGGDCGNPLEVDGAFIANNIAFRRVAGGVNEAATGFGADRCRANAGFYDTLNRRCSAETFRFHPSMYLAEPIFILGDEGAAEYPIQQIRDLPPVF